MDPFTEKGRADQSTSSIRLEVLGILGIGLAFGLFPLVYIMWFVAFVEGGRTWYDISLFGEMYLELVLWAVLVPIEAVAFWAFATGRLKIVRK